MRQPGADLRGAGPAAGGGSGGDASSSGGAPFAGLGGPHLSSSWRYASLVQSTDSDSFSEQVTTAYASPSTAVPADGSLPPTATGSPASTPGSREPSSTGRQLWSSPSKRPHMQPHPQQHHHASTNYPPAPGSFAAPHLPVPAGVDAASYAAGERAALMLAFQQALPGQQALGQLFSAVDALHSRLEEEAKAWRALQLGASKADGLLEAVLQRMDLLEHNRLPQLQEKWEETARRAPEQLVELVGSLQQVVALLAQQRQLLVQQRQDAGSSGGAGAPYVSRRLPWLLVAAAGYGQSLLSKADVAALFLSRKILLTEPEPGDLESGGMQGPQPRLSRQMRAALGALLFVASVEAAWQAQHRALRPLPALAQRMAAPLQLGLKVTRAAVWSAALVLAAAQTRASCRAAGDSICGAVDAAIGAVKLPAWMQALRWSRASQAQQQQQQPQAALAQLEGGTAAGADQGAAASHASAADALPVLVAPSDAAS